MKAMDHKLASESLGNLIACLNSNFQGRFFAAEGTLLGLIRQGGFIDGDLDIDIGMWIEDFDDCLISDLRSAGFNLIDELGTREDGLILKFHDGLNPVDIMFYYRSQNAIWMAAYKGEQQIRYCYPLFDIEKRSIGGFDVFVPAEPEKYLEVAYGKNWRVPVTTWDYRYAPKNAIAHGSLKWRMFYSAKRMIWHMKNRNIHVQPGTVTASQTSSGQAPAHDHSGSASQAERIVYTDGVFDLLHANHIALLKEARAIGDKLVVGVVSDREAAKYKRLPIISQDERLFMIRNLSCVDEVFILDEPCDREAMKKILAEREIYAVVYAGNQSPDFYRPAEQAGIMHRLPYHPGINSSEIITRIIDRHENGDL